MTGSNFCNRLAQLTVFLMFVGARVSAQASPQATAPSSSQPAAASATPPAPAAPTRANVLRGAYGPYRANNDLLSYHLDMRVDPEKQTISGKNTIRFKMLQDGTRIQLDLHRRARTSTRSFSARLRSDTYRDSGAVFVDFPETLHAGQEYTIDFYYSGHPLQTAPLRRFHVRQRSRRPSLDLHRMRGHWRQRLVAEQRSVARRSREHADQRRDSQRPRGCLQRKIRGQDRSGRRLHALGLAGAISHQQLRRIAQHRQLRALLRPSGRPAARFLRAARRSGQSEKTIRAGQGHDRGLPTLFRRVSLPEGRLQADRSALLRHGAPERGHLRQSLQQRLPGPRLDRRGHQPEIRFHHHPRKRARVVRQQRHGRRPLGHVDPRRLDHVSGSLYVEYTFGHEDAIKYLNGYKSKVQNRRADHCRARHHRHSAAGSCISRARFSSTRCAAW